MREVNRSAVTVVAKMPLVDWVNIHDDGSCPMTLEDCNRESTVYLLPEYSMDDERLPILREFYLDIFRNELFSYYTDESLWPGDLTFELFREWIEIVPTSQVFDLDGSTLAAEEA